MRVPTPLPTLLKRLLFGLLLAVLLLPAVQTRFPLFKMGDLGGYAEQAPQPEFSWPGIFDTTYQPALEKYVEGQIGFRELLIRLRNQLAYSVFGVCKANTVLVGQDNILLSETAIRAYLGEDFRGNSLIRSDVRHFKAVQDTLARRGILLVFAIAPDKANFYAEKWPSYFRVKPHSQSNYTAYTQQMRRSGVNLIDLADLFLHWKDTASYPLFPRGGIHWSGYGIPMAADTLFHYIEQKGRFDLPDFSPTSHIVTNIPRDTDNDIAKSLNLLHEPAADSMSYPYIQFTAPKPNQQKPKLLIVGDSFVWSFIGFYPYVQNLFSDKTQFWYYNTEVQWGIRDDMPSGNQVSQLDRKAEIFAQDVVLVLFTQHNLAGFDNGFSANTYTMLFPYTATDLTKVQAIEEKLKTSPALQDSIWKQANATNQDYNQLFHNMAVAQYELIR